MNILLILGALAAGCALEGCSFLKPEPIIVEVKVPVPVYCKIDKVAKPVLPLQELYPEEEDIFRIVQSALAEIELRQGYETKLEASITACNSEVK